MLLRSLIRRSLAASQRVYHPFPESTHDLVDTVFGEKRYVDRLKLTVRGGNGGAGCVSLWKGTSKGKFRPPDGGDGGAGGNVVIRASSQVKSLAGLPQLLCAEHGGHGGNQKRHGKKGKDAILQVPLGTIVTKIDQDTLVDASVADLVSNGQEILVARGGQGTKGNAAEPKTKRGAAKQNDDESQVRELDAVRAGETCHISLELKFMSDVALLGLPNVGKSSLLNALTDRQQLRPPSVPTTRTRLGALRLSPHSVSIIADVPSITLPDPMTSRRPLWHLRHAHRAKVLVLVIDAFRSDPHQLSMWEQLKHLRTELEHEEDSDLSIKPWIVAVNKIDLLDSNDGSSITAFVNRCRRAGAISVVQTSAGMDKTNVSSLKRALTRILANIVS